MFYFYPLFYPYWIEELTFPDPWQFVASRSARTAGDQSLMLKAPWSRDQQVPSCLVTFADSRIPFAPVPRCRARCFRPRRGSCGCDSIPRILFAPRCLTHRWTGGRNTCSFRTDAASWPTDWRSCRWPTPVGRPPYSRSTRRSSGSAWERATCVAVPRWKNRSRAARFCRDWPDSESSNTRKPCRTKETSLESPLPPLPSFIFQDPRPYHKYIGDFSTIGHATAIAPAYDF